MCRLVFLFLIWMIVFSLALGKLRADLNGDHREDLDMLGDELILDGGFDTGDPWFPDLGWTISGGKANFSWRDSQTNQLCQYLVLQVGHKYRVVFTMSDIEGPVACVFNLGTESGTARTEEGTYTEDFIVPGDDLIIYGYFEGGSFSVDNVSVREVLGGAGSVLIQSACESFYEN